MTLIAGHLLQRVVHLEPCPGPAAGHGIGAHQRAVATARPYRVARLPLFPGLFTPPVLEVRISVGLLFTGPVVVSPRRHQRDPAAFLDKEDTEWTGVHGAVPGRPWAAPNRVGRGCLCPLWLLQRLVIACGVVRRMRLTGGHFLFLIWREGPPEGPDR
ncbi:hypothetical protein GCM10018966_067750 [Streptomyces yanii]